MSLCSPNSGWKQTHIALPTTDGVLSHTRQRSFAGLGFLSSWYLAGKLKAFDRRGHVAKLCIVFLPLLCASLIAISRVDDYWHHWQDVFAGGFLGLVIASFCYLQFFPPPYDVDGWFPHAYLHAMADSRHNDQPAANPLQSRPSEIETVYVSSEGQDGIHSRDTSSILDSMEAGRRQRVRRRDAA
ncbi:hypothetical protein C4D60_Mb06t02880 [Musa balbisiana]|uniref:Phosphatidic acid phosphatase type 2/haloperoxidase domain-containing protein n=1 Tax=Musa balbisiana TaxID=52838 RepID=A0A4V4H3M2_MUSBA|nr:hypothetical protein C4D60_Mb06t02880 [Musa balbisiana]